MYMDIIFIDAKSFNHDLSKWDVSRVTDMTRMFDSAFSFNQNLFDWDVSRVTKMNVMFLNAIAFTKTLKRCQETPGAVMNGPVRPKTSFGGPGPNNSGDA